MNNKQNVSFNNNTEQSPINKNETSPGGEENMKTPSRQMYDEDGGSGDKEVNKTTDK